MNPITYKDSGVDIHAGEELVERIKKKVKSTYGERVYGGVGGFAALYEVGNDKLIAAGTDGIGTKIKIAQKLGIHNTVGIDLVAMSINDILCTGASPLFFLDYLACGKLDLNVSEALIDGVVEGCLQSECALIGGETAEMPGVYPEDEYDLAGFAIGEVMKKDLIDGSKVTPGMTIIGLPSSGLHSNGYSLARRILTEDDHLKLALTPTKIYQKPISKLLHTHRENILGMAHITGGGFLNINRINPHVDYELNNIPGMDEISPIFSIMKEKANLDLKEMYQTFNMGVGYVLITDTPESITQTLNKMKERHWVLGKTCKGSKKVYLKKLNITL